MALRGNLKDFSLPDVFQLVTFSRKTGILRITRQDGAEGAVWFRDGDVFFASSNWHKELLGERLVRAQRITPQALSKALQIRASEPFGGRRLGKILIEEGYITEAVLESFVSDQIQDTIFDLMRWDDGEFDFETMPEVVNEDIGLSVSIENVVMEGSRRLEEWTRIRKKIPSMSVVFKMATAPGEGTFEISLKPVEWQLLLLIDGTRTVSELATESGRTDFEVARVIYGLFSAGLLEFATDEEVARGRAEREAREARLAQLDEERREAERLAAETAQAAEDAARAAEEAAKAAEDAAAAEQARIEATSLAAAVVHEVERAGAAGELEPDAEASQEELSVGEGAEAEPTVEVVTEGHLPLPEAVEVPEFLAGPEEQTEPPEGISFEQVMGAVLHPQPQTEPTPEPQVEPAEPYEPVEIPEFIAAQTSAPTESEAIPVTSLGELLGMHEAPAPAVEESEAAPVDLVPAESTVEAPWEPELETRGARGAAELEEPAAS